MKPANHVVFRIYRPLLSFLEIPSFFARIPLRFSLRDKYFENFTNAKKIGIAADFISAVYCRCSNSDTLLSRMTYHATGLILNLTILLNPSSMRYRCRY